MASFPTTSDSCAWRWTDPGCTFAAAGSSRGQQLDTGLVIGPWDFGLDEVQGSVQRWHGDRDRNASPGIFRHLAGSIPNSRGRLLPAEGHISLIVNHASEILAELVRAAKQSESQPSDA